MYDFTDSSTLQGPFSTPGNHRSLWSPVYIRMISELNCHCSQHMLQTSLSGLLMKPVTLVLPEGLCKHRRFGVGEGGSQSYSRNSDWIIGTSGQCCHSHVCEMWEYEGRCCGFLQLEGTGHNYMVRSKIWMFRSLRLTTTCPADGLGIGPETSFRVLSGSSFLNPSCTMTTFDMILNRDGRINRLELIGAWVMDVGR